MDINVKMVPCITMQDVEKLINAECENCEFMREAGDESYKFVNTDANALGVLRRNFENAMNHFGYDDIRDIRTNGSYPNYVGRLLNQINLVSELRARGYIEGVFVEVC